MSDLMKYLPPYYEDVEEIISLTDAENPEIDKLWNGLLSVRLNQFIMDADETRIKQWEKLLNIMPDYLTQNLDSRKAIVIMRLSTVSPITHRWLIEKLADTFGEGFFQVELNHNEYSLEVSFRDENNIMAEFRKYLRQIIPANLSLHTKALFPHDPVSASNVKIRSHVTSRRKFVTNPVRL